MDASVAIMWMIAACTVFFIVLIFSKPLKSVIKVIVRGVLGLLGVFIGNLILSPIGLNVGINLLTGFIIGVLGIPGFVSLYIAQYFL